MDKKFKHLHEDWPNSIYWWRPCDTVESMRRSKWTSRIFCQPRTVYHSFQIITGSANLLCWQRYCSVKNHLAALLNVRHKQYLHFTQLASLHSENVCVFDSYQCLPSTNEFILVPKEAQPPRNVCTAWIKLQSAISLFCGPKEYKNLSSFM